MSIVVTLKVDKSAPQSGDTVTATYVVTGLSPISGTLSGSVTVAGKVYPSTVTIGDVVSYAVPTIAGLTFKATADPAVFTALVP